MDWFLDDGDVKIAHGDALEQLAAMPDCSVQCIVTSPPFWALRDYGTGRWDGGDAECDHAAPPRGGPKSGPLEGASKRSGNGGDGQYGKVCGKCRATRIDEQIGLEATPDEWCARLVAVFRECRRVLRDDGVFWLEVGDTYAGGGGSGNATETRDTGFHGSFKVTTSSLREKGGSQPVTPKRAGVKPKDLVGAPWMLAFALRADGWYLRSDTIWARPNPMPESVTDRPTKAHSYVFLLTKSARYFYDADAIREPHAPASITRYQSGGSGANGKPYSMQQSPRGAEAGANARSVWSIATEPTPFAHFATFPQALVERCILAGTSERGACAACGAPWTREVAATGADNHRERRPASEAPGHAPSGIRSLSGATYQPMRQATNEWSPTCACKADIRPCVVLDPFMGSGTTALVARRLGRHAVGIELNAEYLTIARTRLQQLSLLGGAS